MGSLIPIVGLAALTAATAAAQATASPDPLAALERTAQAKVSEWDMLAKGLEARAARLLPCDPRVRSAIEEVSAASEARVAALRQYLKEAAARAKNDTEAAERLAADHDARAAELSTERTEAEAEQNALEGQITNIGESVKRRAALADAQKALAQIAGLTRQRVLETQTQASRQPGLSVLLHDLATGYQARQRALESQLSALEAEAARWRAYYEARLARAHTECTITQSTEIPQRPERKKK